MYPLRQIITHLLVKGPVEITKSLKQRINPQPCPSFRQTERFFVGQEAVEIGDVSPSFCAGNCFPIYPLLKRIDRVLPTAVTEWTATAPSLQSAETFITCGVTCAGVPTKAYDVVLSSHVLEHLANPLKALVSWRALLREKGRLVLLLPRRTQVIDHLRPQTTFAHLLSDYETDMPETDNTHVEEFVRCFDHGMNLNAIHSEMDIIKLAARHAETGIIHHHTWDGILTAMAVNWAGFTLESICYHPPFHICCVAQVAPNPKTGK